MRILKIHLENFQGIKEFDFAPDGTDKSLYGDNGTGKTTLANAFCWLLYDKPSTDEKNYSPQTVGTHHLDHIAEMVVEDEGKQTALKKTFHEVYKTKRGSADKLFSGYTTDYEINGVPSKKTDYQKTVSGIIKNEEMAKLLTRPFYFLEDMDVKERRKLLLEICGDVDDEAVITQSEELAGLPGVLDGRTVEEYLAVAKAQKRKIDGEIKEIPGRIDEVSRMRPDIPEGMDEGELSRKLGELKAKKEGLERKKAAAPDTAVIEVQKQIAEVETQLAQERAAWMKAGAEEMDRANRKRADAASVVEGGKKTLRRLEDQKYEKQELVKRMKEMREIVLEEWKKEKAREWGGSDVCPTCGQKLPQEQIERAAKQFNLQKAKKLEDITQRGKQFSQDKIEKLEQEIKELESSIGMQKQAIEKDSFLEQEAAQKYAEAQERYRPEMFMQTQQAVDLRAKIEGLQDRIECVGGAEEGIDLALEGQISEVDGKMEELQALLSDIRHADELDQRKEDLEGREKELAAQYETVEHGIFLCEQFSRRKAELLDEKVNGRFSSLKFRLFQTQVNGGIADDCEALIPCGQAGPVPFKSANNAARINAGLEVMDVLAQHFGVSLPIFIDGAEGCTSIRPTQAQQIRLYVSEKDKELRCDV